LGENSYGTQVLDAITGVEQFFVAERGVLDMAFSPDGSRLATASWAGATVRDASTGAAQFCFRHRDRQGVKAVAFSPDGTRLVTCAHDKTVRIWGIPSSPPNSQ
jgi:WD40 repeat protein